MVLAGRTKLSVSKNFFRGHLFVFVEYLCNRSPKFKTKNIKNCSSILAIVNHWNWLDDSPPLIHPRRIRRPILWSSNDSSALDVFQKMVLLQFWCAMRESYPQVSEVGFQILLPFAATYLCESGFSALVHINTKARIEGKLKMIWDWFYRTLNHKSLNWFCGCITNRRTNRRKIEQF